MVNKKSLGLFHITTKHFYIGRHAFYLHPDPNFPTVQGSSILVQIHILIIKFVLQNVCINMLASDTLCYLTGVSQDSV